MLSEVLEALAPADGKTYVDATFGNGGYSEAVLEKQTVKSSPSTATRRSAPEPKS